MNQDSKRKAISRQRDRDTGIALGNVLVEEGQISIPAVMLGIMHYCRTIKTTCPEWVSSCPELASIVDEWDANTTKRLQEFWDNV